MSIEELYSVYLQYPSIQTDTRKLKKGDIYFALKGPSFNGNAFAQQALSMGAAYAVVDEEISNVSGNTILVDDVLYALQQLATHHRKQFTIPFIAITGSNGKTTTKELLHATLSSTFKTYTTEGNLNNHIGVPLTILKIKKDAQFAIIEMGANHLGEIASYCEIAQPTHGLITNCGKAHLEGFGSEEGVKKAKGELFDYLRKMEGTAFVMWDYEYLQKMSNGIAKIITYGTKEASVEGQIIEAAPFLKVAFNKGFEGTITTSLVGAYNLPNVLAAVAIGHFFGVPDDAMKKAIEEYQPTNSRSQLIVSGSNQLIVDAYNANPSSMKVAIENFAATPGNQKVLVLGAMAELGKESIAEHQQIIDEINKYSWTKVALVGGDFTEINHLHHQFQNASEAGEWLQKQNFKNTYFLIKGSRSMQMEKVLDYVTP